MRRTIAATIAAAITLAICSASPPPPADGPALNSSTLASVDRPPSDTFAAARAAVFASLKDPDSARFGELAAGKGAAVCGRVNARNGFGGFTGMRAFAYSPAAAEAERLLLDEGAGDWVERGGVAEMFADRGCSIGTDQAKAVAARRAMFRSSEK